DQVLTLQLKNMDSAETTALLANFDHRLSTLMGPPPPNYGAAVTPVNTDQTSLEHLYEVYTELEDAVESADRPPTREQQAASQTYNKTLQTTLTAWRKFVQQDLARLNTQLQQAGLPRVSSAATAEVPGSEEY